MNRYDIGQFIANNKEYYKEDAIRKVTTRFIEDYIKDKILKDPQILENVWDNEDDQQDFIRFISKQIPGKFPYVWLTVNPKKGTSIPEFHKRMQKAMRKCFIKNAIWIYECRNHTGKVGDQGFHVHAIIELSKKKKASHIKREFFSTFKSFVGNKRHVYTICTYNIDKNIQYIMGNKKKDYCPRPDKLFRIQHNLKHYYHTTPDGNTCSRDKFPHLFFQVRFFPKKGKVY